MARFGVMTANRMFTASPSMAAKSTPSGHDEQRRELRLELRQGAVRDGDPLADPVDWSCSRSVSTRSTAAASARAPVGEHLGQRL